VALRLTDEPTPDMGYACPVCDTPQRDGEHLAHHLAFTAMLHGGDHEDWLDERVPDWGDREPAELAAEVTPHAEDAEYDEVFEDTVSRGRPDVGMGSGSSPTDDGRAGRDDAGHDHAGHGHSGQSGSRGVGVPSLESVDDPTVAEAIREARELTRAGAENGDAADDADSEGNDADPDEGDADLDESDADLDEGDA